jgi:hypothetical protein
VTVAEDCFSAGRTFQVGLLDRTLEGLPLVLADDWSDAEVLLLCEDNVVSLCVVVPLMLITGELLPFCAESDCERASESAEDNVVELDNDDGTLPVAA